MYLGWLLDCLCTTGTQAYYQDGNHGSFIRSSADRSVGTCQSPPCCVGSHECVEIGTPCKLVQASPRSNQQTLHPRPKENSWNTTRIYGNRVTQIVWWLFVWNTTVLLPMTFGAPRHAMAQLSHPSWSNSPNIFMALCLYTDTTSRNLPDFYKEKRHIQHAKSVTYGQQKQKYPHTGILKCN